MKKAEVISPEETSRGFEIPADILPKKICFVCTGNTCRSPMAAAVLNHYGRDKGYQAVSAGLSVYSPHGISQNAEIALKHRGIVPTEGNRYDLHTSRQIDENILSECDRVIGITESHAMSLIFAYPQFASKIYPMDKDISDPYGGDEDVYISCLDDIIEAVRSMFVL